MRSEYYIILILLIHFISDFLFQSRKMGRNKGKDISWLTIHVLVYSIVTTIGWSILLPINFTEIKSIFVITFYTHWITDYITSKGSGYCYLKMIDGKVVNKERWEFLFWSVIGFDQFIHSLTLILTYSLI